MTINVDQSVGPKDWDYLHWEKALIMFMHFSLMNMYVKCTSSFLHLSPNEGLGWSLDLGGVGPQEDRPRPLR